MTRATLSALARDTRANTMAMMAMALIPLAGMVGGGIDISRMYIVKTRLQHACDAGALAGRKAMGGGTWSNDNYAARTEAERFFDANFDANAYGTSLEAPAQRRSFAESAGKVTGNARAIVPMTLMRIFGKTQETLSVTCDAEMRLPNTDVMFVLDTTGSMNETPSGDTKTKIAGLKFAVKCFYQIIARLDVSDADCEGDEPSGGTGGQVQIRFGFVPYSTNVNVGRLLQTGWIADNWSYQTRENMNVAWEWSAWLDTSIRCSDTPENGTNVEYRRVTDWRGRCTGVQTRYYGPKWRYDRLTKNVSGLKNGSGWNNSLTLPIGDFATNKLIRWDGCIEERTTSKQTDYDPIPSAAKDLDIDLVPDSDATRWGPALPDILYTRRSGEGNWDRSRSETVTNYRNTSSYYCPTAAKKLQAWSDPSTFAGYVNSLTPSGNTYHDIGLLWGARLMSPTGLFAAENATTPQGAEIERHLIFMTDGDTNTSSSDYNAYGIPWFDRRQTDSTSNFDLDQQVDLRFAALCTAIRNKNITLWVISFGTVSTETEDRLRTCADSGRYFSAADSVALQQTFKSIADQISQLRLTK